MVSAVRTRRRRTFRVAAVFVLVMATGCGSRAGSPSPDAAEPRSTGATVTGLPRTPTPALWPPRYPSSALYSDPVDLVAYRLAYDECIVLPPSQLAAGY